jgi:recombination associated protein RdgC
MFFKNINTYKIVGDFTSEDISSKINEFLFQPCQYGALTSGGWISPMGEHYNHPVHSANGCDLICYKDEVISVPKSVIEEELNRRITELLKNDESIKYVDFTKKRKRAMSSEIASEFVSGETVKCFTKSSKTFGYIDYNKKIIVVDSSSAKKSETFILHIIALLRGKGVKLIPLKTVHEPCRQMSNWVTSDQLPSDLSMGDSIKLKDMDDDGSIKYSKHDISDDKIHSYLNEEKTVSELKVDWTFNDSDETFVTLTITEDFVIKSVKMSKELISTLDDDYSGDEVADFDTKYCLMINVFGELVTYMIDCFGGEYVEESDD